MRKANRNASGGRPGSTRGGVKVVEEGGFTGPSTQPRQFPNSGVTQTENFRAGIDTAREQRQLVRPRSDGNELVKTGGDMQQPSPPGAVAGGISRPPKASEMGDKYARVRR